MTMFERMKCMSCRSLSLFSHAFRSICNNELLYIRLPDAGQVHVNEWECGGGGTVKRVNDKRFGGSFSYE